DHPGIERVEIPLGDWAATPAVLSPYAPSQPVHEEPGPAAPGTEARRAASKKLYGRGLGAALQRYTAAALRRLAGREFDVVHAHDWMTIPTAMQLRLATGRPVCLQLHSTSFDRSGAASLERDPIRRLEAIGARTADRVIAVSEYGRGVVHRECGAQLDRIDVVLNAAPQGAALEPAPLPDPGRPVVLFLARLTRQKGAAFLLRAAPAILEQVPSARLVIAGAGDARAELIEASAALGVATSVFFPGSLSDTARDRAYREAAVFVLPSVSEPFGLTPLEALRFGTPSVVSAASGVREVLTSAPAPEPWDRDALAREVSSLLVDEERRAALVAAGRREVAGATWARSATSLTETFARAVEESARSGRRANR
ncbi:MAG: glycosyltransferase family 4 protein, partial [Planctomycetota bacterium]|nr:glycosyltransferase family 4 protein [Planctomycetota bacterium]